MRNIKLEIEYDGTNFAGWEIQPNKRTVREEIERKLGELFQEQIKLIGGARTDAGVHAICQVANFITHSNCNNHSNLPIPNIKRALLRLPPDIYVKDVSLMPIEFNARRDAISRVYLYRLLLGKSPLLRTKVWEYKYKLDIQKIENIIPVFLGVHRFDLFSYKESGECEVKHLSVIQNSDEIVFEISANRFLHRMVRMIIGTLTELGRGKIDEKDIKASLELSGDDHSRGKKYLCAPPCGLYLKEIKYL